MVRWLWDNLGTILLAFVLALIVWVAAINSEDPVREAAVPGEIPIELSGLGEGLIVVDSSAQIGQAVVRAPESVWINLGPENLDFQADLSGLEAGVHQIQIPTPTVDLQPARVVSFQPTTITVELDALVSKVMPVTVETIGEPALGYRAMVPDVEPSEVTVKGPNANVEQVTELRSQVSLAGWSDDVEVDVRVRPLDESGAAVEGVELQPAQVSVKVPIIQLGGYRSVAVLPTIEGQTETGYRVTNISVVPTQVILLLSDSEAADAMPGFVKTEPLDITGSREDLERRLSLDLPEGASLVGEQSVLVRVSIDPVVSSITVTREFEIQGLAQGLYAMPSLESVSVILTGPLTTLDSLEQDDVRVVLNLLDLSVGTHQVEPNVVVSPTDVTIESILPATIEVTITSYPVQSPTPTPESTLTS